MPALNSTAPATWRYGPLAVLLHWVLAALIMFMTGLGWYMMTIEHAPGGPWYIDLHKSVGLIVFALILLRVLWRLGHRPEPLPADLPPWQEKLSKVTHRLLYACMLVMPVTGIIGASYQRSGLGFFGIALPRLVTPNRDTAEFFFGIHSFTVWILVALVVVHVAAGLKHLLVDHDEVFSRMWPAHRR